MIHLFSSVTKKFCFFAAKPDNTNITLTPKRANVGEKVTITCESDGFPEPKYNITHNGTEISTEKTYIIPKVEWKHAGTYKCFVWNALGNDSDSDILTVEGKITFLDGFCFGHSILSLSSCENTRRTKAIMKKYS